MDNRFEIARLILVLFSLGAVLADNWALLRSQDDKYTPSRALKWLPRNSIETFEEAVEGFSEYLPVGTNADDELYTDRREVEEFRFYICRARDRENGRWVLGTVRRSNRVCQIRLTTSSDYNAEHYEVLHNARGAVYLKWTSVSVSDPWPDAIPTNAVSVDRGYIITRFATDDIVKYAGVGKSKWIVQMDPNSNEEVMRVTHTAENESISPSTSKTVEILVEVEPVLYTVNVGKVSGEIISYTTLSRRVLKVGEISLRNTFQSSMKVESVMPFHWPYDSYWHFNDTILKGVSITIRKNDSNLRETFGSSEITSKLEMHNGFYRVSAYLPANTGVKVTLQGNLLRQTHSLAGSMSTLLDDEHVEPKMPRPISAFWMRTVLTDFEATYGFIYHLPDDSIAAVANSSTPVHSKPVAISTSNSAASMNSSDSTTLTNITNSPITMTSLSKLLFNITTNTTTSITTTTTTTTTPSTTTEPTPSTRTTPVYPTTSTTTTPTPITPTTPSKSINLDIYFMLKLKIPVK